ncbi:STAS domain-containing protein [Cytobacillus suaedae]|nr:STAS domain-containing protein [Cytobacillus suaedae]
MSQNGLTTNIESDEKLRLNRLASIGQLSAGIAHEVRNPLTAVKGFLQLVNEEKSEPYIDIALTELDNALSTLNNLLQVSKPDLEAEKYVSINLCSELEAILALFQDQIYRVEIIKSFSNCDKVILGQRNTLKKAFFNLLKNAFEAIEDRGSITVDLYSSGEELCVRIKDTGVGIPSEKLELLGTPFFSTKDNGTGMGLTQVFTTLHKHGAKVKVESFVGIGTTFDIVFPITQKKEFKVTKMDGLQYIENHSFKEFLYFNKEVFDDLLQKRSRTIFAEIKDSPITEDHLHEIALRIVSYLDQDSEHELLILAKQQGVEWAKHDLPSIIKLEWFQGLRSLYWDFMYNFFKNCNVEIDEFFSLEKKTNYYLDMFLNHYIISFNEYKNNLFHSQREVIEELSVPIIPLTDTVAVLPIVGTMDTYRAKKLQEKTLREIEKNKFKKMIIDLSGVAYLDTAVVAHMFKIIDGFRLLGCNAVVTGIRSEVANTMIELGVALDDKVETRADLKQALEDFKIL